MKKRSSRPRDEFEDDGRTIADMSQVDSMGDYFLRPLHRRSAEPAAKPSEEAPPTTRRERIAVVLGAMGATLVIGLIFLAGLGIIIGLMLAFW